MSLQAPKDMRGTVSSDNLLLSQLGVQKLMALQCAQNQRSLTVCCVFDQLVADVFTVVTVTATRTNKQQAQKLLSNASVNSTDCKSEMQKWLNCKHI